MVINAALIHNIYGDADHLIVSAPEDVVCIARSWTPEAEASLRELMDAQGVASISCLPAFLFRHDEGIYEIRVADLPTPWTWDDIFDARDALIDRIDNPPDPDPEP